MCIIPARYGSTRFPGKLLALLAGKPVLQHVYERAGRSSALDDVLVATDDGRILEAVRSFGGNVVMTKASHPSGTDRIAEAVRKIKADLIINIQGDEPGIEPRIITRLVRAMQAHPAWDMGTVITPVRHVRELTDPNAVKVVCDRVGRALYFSRSPIPFIRDRADVKNVTHYRHIGMYAYRYAVLKALVRLPVSPAERAEKLEQLRALENGFSIGTITAARAAEGVDTPADLARLKKRWAKEKR